MKIKHIKHNACRLLSLLLVVAALSGLLTIGAWADEATAPEVTLEVVVATESPVAGQPLDLEIWLKNIPEGKDVAAFTLALDCPATFTIADDYYDIDIVKGNTSYGDGPSKKIVWASTRPLSVDECIAKVKLQTPSDVAGEVVFGIKNDESLSATSFAAEVYKINIVSDTVNFPSATLKFDMMNDQITPIDDMVVAPSTAIVMPTPEAEGYNFGGWYSDAAYATLFDASAGLEAGDVHTVYAKWTGKNYTVTFDPNGGKLPDGAANTKSVIYYQEYGELPTPTREGYKFNGWVRAGTKIPVSSENIVDLAQDHTIKAEWVDKYDITVVSPDNTTFTYGDSDIAFVPALNVSGVSSVAAPTDYTVYYWVNDAWQTDAPDEPGTYKVKVTREADDDFKALAVEIESALVINKKSVAQPTQGPSSFTYNTTAQNFTYTHSADSALYTQTADSAPNGTNAGNYTIKFALNEPNHYQWVDKGNSDDLVFTYTIEKASVTKPAEITKTYTYNGSEQSYEYNAAPEGAEIDTARSVLSGKDAGTVLKVVYKLTDMNNYKWADGESEPLTYSATIQKLAVDEPAQNTDTFIYNGSEQVYTVAASEYYTVSNNTRTDAGTQKVRIELTSPESTVWKTKGDSNALEYDFTIDKAPVAKPVQETTSFTYDGSDKTFSVTGDDSLYTISGDTKGKTVGTYTLTVSLKDDNHKWADGTTDDLTFTFTIAPKPVTAPTEGSGTYTYNASQQTYAFGSAGDEADYTVTGNKQKDAGTYTVTVSLKDKTNTAWADGTTADKTFTFTIAKADQAAPTGVTAENESIFKKGDGKITGVDNTMEYSADDGKTWTKISGNKLENLKPGEYKVRYAETDNCNASPDASVTVGEGTKLKASFNTGAGSDVDDQTNLGYGDALTKPEATYDGFTLVGWYKEDSYKHAWDFATDRMGDEDITLYAKWELSIGIEGDARFTEGKAPAEGVKIIVGKGLDQTADTKTIELQKVTVDGKKLDAENYTVAYGEDGLTITLKQEYLNTLADDEYEIGVVVESEHLNGTERKLSVTLTVDPVQGAAGKPAAKPGKAVKTGDSSDLLLWSVLTLGAGAGLVCIGKKRREN